MELKYEKIYTASINLVKKWYAGMKIENPADGTVPILECKGIETIWSDQVKATAKILDRVLHILFNTRDLSKVKEYLYS